MYKVTLNKNNIIDHKYYNNIKDVEIVKTRYQKEGYLVVVIKVK